MVVAFSFPFKHSIFEAAIFYHLSSHSQPATKKTTRVLYSTGEIVEIMQSIYEIMKKVIIVK